MLHHHTTGGFQISDVIELLSIEYWKIIQVSIGYAIIRYMIGLQNHILTHSNDCKRKTNCNLVTRVFPRLINFLVFTSNFLELFRMHLSFLFTAVITLVWF